MRLNFALIAQSVNIAEDGKVEIYNPITELSASAVPAVHSEAAVVINFLTGDTNEHDLGIKIIGSYNKDCICPYATKTKPAKSVNEPTGHVVYLREIVLEEVYVDKKLLATVPFSFRIVRVSCPDGLCERR
jgi:hypothetical protein